MEYTEETSDVTGEVDVNQNVENKDDWVTLTNLEGRETEDMSHVESGCESVKTYDDNSPGGLIGRECGDVDDVRQETDMSNLEQRDFTAVISKTISIVESTDNKDTEYFNKSSLDTFKYEGLCANSKTDTITQENAVLNEQEYEAVSADKTACLASSCTSDNGVTSSANSATEVERITFSNRMKSEDKASEGEKFSDSVMTTEGDQRIVEIKPTSLVDNETLRMKATQDNHLTDKTRLSILIQQDEQISSELPHTSRPTSCKRDASIKDDPKNSTDMDSEINQVSPTPNRNDMRSFRFDGNLDTLLSEDGAEKTRVMPLPQTPFTPWFSPPPKLQNWLPFSISRDLSEALKARLFSHFHATSTIFNQSYSRRHHSDGCFNTSSGPTMLRQGMFFNQWGGASVSLRQSELSHIVHAISKAELDDAFCASDERLCKMLQDGKVCFYCRTTRFTFFGRRGRRCSLCRRMICEECLIKVRLPHEYMDNVPVFTLCPKDSVVYKSALTKSINRSLSLPSLATLNLPRARDDCATVVEYRRINISNYIQTTPEFQLLMKQLKEKQRSVESSRTEQNVKNIQDQRCLNESEINLTSQRQHFIQHSNQHQQGLSESHGTSLQSMLHKAKLKYSRGQKFQLQIQHQNGRLQKQDQPFEKPLPDLLINPFMPSLHDLRTDIEGPSEAARGKNEQEIEGLEVCFGCESTLIDVIRFNRWRPSLSLLMLSHH